MTTATFHPGRLHGLAIPPPSKSEAHRALLLAALGRGHCRLHGFGTPLCDDTQAMINGIIALGARVVHEGDMLVVEPAPAKPEKGIVCFHVHACAAALRMLIPAFWVRDQAVNITMEAALFARPLDALLPLAEQIGGSVTLTPPTDEGFALLELRGRMNAGSYTVDGSLSSQYASGLLIALPHATDAAGQPASSTLTITPPIVSRPYLDMTLEQMRRFRIPWTESQEGVFSLPNVQEQNPGDAQVAGDWSQAAVLLCANALGSGVMLGGLRIPGGGEVSLQGDARVLNALGQMGMLLCETSSGLYAVSPSRPGLMPLHLDCEDIPDIAPILALVCSQARGISTLTGVRRLRVKECDRLLATQELLRQLGAEVSVSADSDTLTIVGQQAAGGHMPRLRGGFSADARNDHRMVMLLAIAALIADGPITVRGVNALDKSWPGFLETYQALGGMIT